MGEAIDVVKTPASEEGKRRLEVVCVINTSMKTPEVESSTDARMGRSSKSTKLEPKHDKHKYNRERQNNAKSRTISASL